MTLWNNTPAPLPSEVGCRSGAAPDRGSGLLELAADHARGENDTLAHERLSLSVETVRSYMRNLMGKLEVRSRQEAVVEARRQGLLP
ncbi:ATP/maltotriose-dependent transcriptional regulator MalT [Rhodococcus opacus]|nr:ATP/maltotriose-dependent transcriptional regulator MalT [Rhodococcus opacus]